jgi:hypothetical protein
LAHPGVAAEVGGVEGSVGVSPGVASTWRSIHTIAATIGPAAAARTLPGRVLLALTLTLTLSLTLGLALTLALLSARLLSARLLTILVTGPLLAILTGLIPLPVAVLTILILAILIALGVLAVLATSAREGFHFTPDALGVVQRLLHGDLGFIVAAGHSLRGGVAFELL